MLKALIFDVDGTLAETEADGHRVAFNQAFSRAGLDWNWDRATYGELLAVFGGKERMWHYWREERPDTFDESTVAERIATIHRDKTRAYADIVTRGDIQLRPGIAELIKQAQAENVITAIATTTTPSNVDALLGTALGPDWERGFPVIVAGDQVPRKKPAPDVYNEALRRLRLDGEDCIALEDSPAGLISARTAGIPCVITRGVYTPPAPLPQALACLTTLGTPEEPASGHGPDGPFSGVVDLEQLRRWHAQARA